MRAVLRGIASDVIKLLWKEMTKKPQQENELLFVVVLENQNGDKITSIPCSHGNASNFTEEFNRRGEREWKKRRNEDPSLPLEPPIKAKLELYDEKIHV